MQKIHFTVVIDEGAVAKIMSKRKMYNHNHATMQCEKNFKPVSNFVNAECNRNEKYPRKHLKDVVRVAVERLDNSGNASPLHRNCRSRV